MEKLKITLTLQRAKCNELLDFYSEKCPIENMTRLTFGETGRHQGLRTSTNRLGLLDKIGKFSRQGQPSPTGAPFPHLATPLPEKYFALWKLSHPLQYLVWLRVWILLQIFVVDHPSLLPLGTLLEKSMRHLRGAVSWCVTHYEILAKTPPPPGNLLEPAYNFGPNFEITSDVYIPYMRMNPRFYILRSRDMAPKSGNYGPSGEIWCMKSVILWFFSLSWPKV